jgi:hypothetical protein
MSKYTESDYRRMHQGIIEDMIDDCIAKWHDQAHDPLEARVLRNIARGLESLRDPEKIDNVWSITVWVSAANDEADMNERRKNNTPKGVAK